MALAVAEAAPGRENALPKPREPVLREQRAKLKKIERSAIRSNRRRLSSIVTALVDDIEDKVRAGGERMRQESLSRSVDPVVHEFRGELSARSCSPVLLLFSMALGLSLCGSAYAQECLRTPQQLLEKKVSDTWKELHQKDNQPLYLTISAGQGDQLHFEGKKPDGSTWISGALSICANAGNQYQVKVDRIDEAPFLVAHQLTGISSTIPAGSSRLKFGTGKHCGNPDPCIEFAAQ